MDADLDKVFKALADPGRRLLLDRLHAENGQTLGQLCEHMDMTRQAVTKHLKVLEEASLVVPIWRGREKLHYLNPVPIHEIAERWIGKFERGRFAPSRTSRRNWKERPMADSRFVYVTYIRTTPEKLWQALIDPEFTRRFWCETWQECEWKPGASWRLMIPTVASPTAARSSRSSPSGGWSSRGAIEFMPEMRAEGHSRLTYELEPQANRSSSPSSMRSTSPTRSSSRPYRTDGRRNPVQPQEPRSRPGESLEETRRLAEREVKRRR